MKLFLQKVWKEIPHDEAKAIAFITSGVRTDIWPYAFTAAIIVGATRELVEAIAEWLREKKKSKSPRLMVTIEGNVLKLNGKSMKVLANMLEEATHKEGRKF